MSSPHAADTKLLDTLADDTRSYMPPTDARRHRSAVARVVYMAQDRPDLDVVACTLAKTMAHPKIEMRGWWREYVGTSRAGHDTLNTMSIKVRPTSWWCKQTMIGHHASPLADLIQEVGCVEVAIFLTIGSELKPVLHLALVNLSCTVKSEVCKSCCI